MRIFKQLVNQNFVESQAQCSNTAVVEEANFTFKVVFNGHQKFSFGKREISLFPDSFILIEPGTTYQTKIDSEEPVKTLSISLTPEFIKEFNAANLWRLQPFLKEQINVDEILPVQTIYPLKGDMWFNFVNLSKRMKEGKCDDLLINEYLQHCLINYYKLYQQEILSKLENLSFVRNSTKKEILNRLTLAKEYISNNYNKKFRLEDISSVCCLSINHLLRTFKQAYGITPYQYLTIVRLNRAKSLLEQGQYSVNEIVMVVGFESVSSFIRLFKTTFNTTPLKYKKEYNYLLN
jgi:AraC-like DNA-binding protein